MVSKGSGRDRTEVRSRAREERDDFQREGGYGHPGLGRASSTRRHYVKGVPEVSTVVSSENKTRGYLKGETVGVGKEEPNRRRERGHGTEGMT